MSLGWYRRPRLIVLNPQTPVLNAARAMDRNHVGAIVVQQAGSVVGIVTDRDLAVRATGRGLDPATTPISAVMSEDVITLPLQATQQEALSLMRTRRIRRIPLLDAGKLAGMVTIDDLVLDEQAPLEEISMVLEAQLGEGGPAASPRSPAAVRSSARAEATYHQLIGRLQGDTGLDSFERTETVVRLVVSNLVRRLTDGEGRDFLSQLPSLLREELRSLPPGPEQAITRESIVQELMQRLDIDPARAESLLEVVGNTILGGISSGQATKVRNQLPTDLRAAVSPAQ